MIRALRFLVLILSVASFQLTLAAGGAECVGSQHGMTSATGGSDSGSPASATGMADMAGNSSSDMPCSPTGTQSCRAMTPCTSAVRVAANDAPAGPVPVPSAALSLIVLAPSSLALAPDLPPPRA